LIGRDCEDGAAAIGLDPSLDLSGAGLWLENVYVEMSRPFWEPLSTEGK
jgi:hypothetical protein